MRLARRQDRDRHRRRLGHRQGHRRAVPRARARPWSAPTSHGTDFECDAGDEEQVEALVAHTVRDHGGLDIFFANAGISGGFASIFEQDAGRLGRDPAGQPDRPVPGDQICRAGDEGARRRVDHRHRLGRRPSLGRGRAGLFGVQGGGDQPGQGRRDPAGRRQHPRQRHLPRPDRDRHDRAASTSAPGPRGRRTRSAISIR